MKTLTPTEARIAEFLCRDAMTAEQIASATKRSVKTIETHKANIFRKLDLHSISQLCRWYWLPLTSSNIVKLVDAARLVLDASDGTLDKLPPSLNLLAGAVAAIRSSQGLK